MRRLVLYVAVAGLLAAAPGCSSPAPRRDGRRVVLAVQPVITDGYTRNTDEIVDIGLPPLHNLTGHAVRAVGRPARIPPDHPHLRLCLPRPRARLHRRRGQPADP